MWNLISGLVTGKIGDFLTHKAEIEKLKAVARIENVGKGIPGYSDEYLILIWSYPFVASFLATFFPQARESVTSGFEFLGTLPDWYVLSFVSLTASVFGIDKLLRFGPFAKGGAK